MQGGTAWAGSAPTLGWQEAGRASGTPRHAQDDSAARSRDRRAPKRCHEAALPCRRAVPSHSQDMKCDWVWPCRIPGVGSARLFYVLEKESTHFSTLLPRSPVLPSPRQRLVAADTQLHSLTPGSGNWCGDTGFELTTGGTGWAHFSHAGSS